MGSSPTTFTIMNYYAKNAREATLKTHKALSESFISALESNIMTVAEDGRQNFVRATLPDAAYTLIGYDSEYELTSFGEALVKQITDAGYSVDAASNEINGQNKVEIEVSW